MSSSAVVNYGSFQRGCSTSHEEVDPNLEDIPDVNKWKGLLTTEQVQNIQLSSLIPAAKLLNGSTRNLSSIRYHLIEILETCGDTVSNKIAPDITKHLEQAIFQKKDIHGNELSNHQILEIHKMMFRIGCLIRGIYWFHTEKYAPLPDEQGNLPADALEESRWSIRQFAYGLDVENPVHDGHTLFGKFKSLFNRKHGDFENDNNRLQLTLALKKLALTADNLLEKIPSNHHRYLNIHENKVLTLLHHPLDMTGLALNMLKRQELKKPWSY